MKAESDNRHCIGPHARLAEDGRSVRTVDTYRYDAAKLAKFIAGVRVGEASLARIDAALRSMRTTHGPTMARRARSLLRGALQLAVLNNVLGTNPVCDVQSIRSKAAPTGASALTAEEVRDLVLIAMAMHLSTRRRLPVHGVRMRRRLLRVLCRRNGGGGNRGAAVGWGRCGIAVEADRPRIPRGRSSRARSGAASVDRRMRRPWPTA